MDYPCLEEDNPVLWNEVKDHIIDMPEDWEGEYPLYCKKCGKRAIMRINMLWMCPVNLEVPLKYFHPG